MNIMRPTPGFYGKMPLLGDFVSRRLPASFVRPWDEWLQQSILKSREDLGPVWLDAFLTSPLWRFILSPGVCGPNARAGVLMPSVDKVGRYFPLTVACCLRHDEILPEFVFTGADWFSRLESLALSALESDFDFDRFDRELERQLLEQVLPTELSRSANRNSPREHESNRTQIAALDNLGGAIVDFEARISSITGSGYSIWFTDGSELVNSSLRVFAGLPDPAAFTEFLAGPRGDSRYSVFSFSYREEDDGPGPTGLFRAPAVTGINYRSSGRTNIGKVRKINQDAYLDRPEIGLWAVADGMGGHQAGEEASKAVVEALGAVSEPHDLEELCEEVVQLLRKVNEDLIDMARGYGAGQIVGSTAVVLLAAGGRCAVIWIGDSRLYRFRDGRLEQMTRDHSLVEELSRPGKKQSDRMAEGAMSNVLTRALGTKDTGGTEMITFEARIGDIFLLCSDGLYREVDLESIIEVLTLGDCERISRELIDRTLANEAKDNVTVVVVRAYDPASGNPGG